jgi:ABC-type transport system involved in cytochrome c biogenesis permease subunit
VLFALLSFATLVCTTTMFVITFAVILPRKQQHRSVRTPLLIGLSVGAVGILLGAWHFVLALSS